MKDLVVAVTGASGIIYGVRLLQALAQAGRRIHLTVSGAAIEVIERELGIRPGLDHLNVAELIEVGLRRYFPHQQPIEPSIASQVTYHHYRDYSAGIASGSFRTGGMVICPCSMGTLASLATGQSQNLIHRAADVHLKERRRLIVVPRETPFSLIAIDNLRRLSEAGAIVLPASPGFYHQPQSMGDLVDFIVARICDLLDVEHQLMQRWGTEPSVAGSDE